MNKHYEREVPKENFANYQNPSGLKEISTEQKCSSCPSIDLSHLFPALGAHKEQRKVKTLKRWSLR